MGALANKTFSLGSAVAQGGTVTTTYPAGASQASLRNSLGGQLQLDTTQASYKQGAGGFTITFNTSDMTITNDSGVTWAAGANVTLSLGTNETIPGSYNTSTRVRGINTLGTSVGTASDTIPDAGASFTQATQNNINASFASKINEIIAAMKLEGSING